MLLEEFQAAQAAATPVGGAASGSSEKATKLVNVVDANVVHKIRTFSGCGADWNQWCFIFESAAWLLDLDSVLGVSGAVPAETGLDHEVQLDDIKLCMKAFWRRRFVA